MIDEELEREKLSAYVKGRLDERRLLLKFIEDLPSIYKKYAKQAERKKNTKKSQP